MARFNLSERMEEVEYSMCAGENCNVVTRKRPDEKLQDDQVLIVENPEGLQETEPEKK